MKDALDIEWSVEATAQRRDRYYAASQRKFVPFKDPMVFRKGAMQYLWDVEGKKYIDLLGMNVCISVGHSHPVGREGGHGAGAGTHPLHHHVLSPGAGAFRRGTRGHHAEGP